MRRLPEASQTSAPMTSGLAEPRVAAATVEAIVAITVRAASLCQCL